jgi:hypothetical protein
VKTFFAAVTRHGPFGPADRQGEKEQRAEVRDHERAAAVGRGLSWETQKIPETDR